MKFKEKLVTQAAFSLMVFATVKSVGMLDFDIVNEAEAFLKEELSKNYTVEDVKEAGSKLLEEAKGVHATVTNAVVKANEMGKYGKPMDENSQKESKPVYAVAGGKVISSGIDEKLGMFIKIRHDETISTYGNLSHLNVLTGDRVIRGDIIGSYDSKSSKAGKDFYFNLDEHFA